MPADEYSSTVRGGLKLKGGAPAGIKKKKKKAKASTTATNLQSALEDESKGLSSKGQGKEGKEGEAESELKGAAEGEEAREVEGDLKTASERAYEEMRRKRLHERLEKEGVKSHKQRVEELNTYLSKLSEHHDMPRIGPG